jgi:hypothetical protein
VFDDQARQLLEALKPYLLLKCEQATLAIEYQALTSDEKAARGHGYREQIIARNLKAQGREAREAKDENGLTTESPPPTIKSHSS